MNLKETIHSIAAQFGESVLDEPLRLLGLLEDLGGFDEEDPYIRKSLREQIRSGEVRQLLETPRKEIVPKLKEDSTDWAAVLKEMNRVGCESSWKKIKKWFTRTPSAPKVVTSPSPRSKPPKVKKVKVNVVPASSPKPRPAKPIRKKRQSRKLTDDQKTNIAIMIWCLLMLACLVTGVTGFWKLFAQTISYSGACWMIFPSIIVGGILWLFNEAF